MPNLDKLQEIALRSKLQELIQQHRDLDVKDKMLRIETLLIPDIIA
jgi:hypothetical protein